MQTLVIRKGQRLLIDAGLCAMGSGLPHAVGAAFTTKGRPVVCFCGDGSFQFNVHELETIVYHQLPIKLFVFNNGGYLSIRQTQEGFLNGHFLGSSKEGGLSVPNITAVAKSYGLPTRQICETDDLAQTIEEVFKTEGPLVCEIAISPVQTIHPKIGFDQISEGIYQARPIEDMWPFLAREDLAELLRSTDAINFYSM
jgi:acetolactate synthase-1/2/3 large subunit